MKKREESDVADELDVEAAVYIRSVRLRHRLFGVDPQDLWAVVLNVQRYYEAKDRERAAAFEAEVRTVRAALEERDDALYVTRRALERAVDLLLQRRAVHCAEERRQINEQCN
ncbi:MAG: hypothetical protein IJH91_04875 [Mogibacterium sp.]|nr:hypothetical protein [Mogibacterium sp.]